MDMQLLVKQKQKFFLTYALKQKINILQMSKEELIHYVDKEIETNPLLERTSCSKLDFLFEQSKKISLYEHLTFQIENTFLEPDEKKIAKFIAGCLNKKGFLDIEIEEIAKFFKVKSDLISNVLKVVQTFDPLGIAARNLRECFLIQLKKNTLTYEIVDKYFESFLKNDKAYLAKKLNISLKSLEGIIQKKLKHINTAPGEIFECNNFIPIVTDIKIFYENGWKIFINDENIPCFKINTKYLSYKLTKEETRYVKHNIDRGKILQSSLLNRKNTLIKIVKFILKHQKLFFLEKEGLRPLKIKKASQDLNMHISTVTRVLANKYISCAMGTFPLKVFFSNPIKNESYSQSTVLKILKKIIQTEDKTKPLTDIKLVKKLESYGMKIARRTVSKYRKKLRITAANKRKV